MNLISKDIEEYIRKYSTKESKLLTSIAEQTYLAGLRSQMLAGQIQGKLLEFFSLMIKPRRVLEIGTFTAYSTICLSKGLTKNGILYTIEKKPELEPIIKQNLQKAKLSKKVKYIIGDAMVVIPQLKETFDLIFIDADKKNYSNYYEMLIPKIRKGGFIIVDNVLWKGKVTTTSHKLDKITYSIIEFNKKVANDKRVDIVILPIRDGLSIIRKK